MAQEWTSPAPIAVTVSHAAELLDCSRQHIYNLLAAGVLPSVKLGRSRRIISADLIEYLEANRVGGRSR
jgi:excisionase family DNA binding protein